MRRCVLEQRKHHIYTLEDDRGLGPARIVVMLLGRYGLTSEAPKKVGYSGSLLRVGRL